MSIATSDSLSIPKKPAKMEDLVRLGEVIPGIRVWIQSIRNPEAPLEEYVTKSDTPLENIVPFILDGKCYIRDGKPPIKWDFEL